MGSNKVTLINDNAVATSSIKKKCNNYYQHQDSENCKESSGREMLYISIF